MKPRVKKWIRKLLFAATGCLVIFVLVFLIYFPGRQTPLAFTLATGIGVNTLQVKVDALAAKAVRDDPFSDEDKRFLRDLYQCFVKGGRLTITLRQSAEMMDRYLSCTGDTLATKPRIFLGSQSVQREMDRLRKRILDDQQRSALHESYTSETFYMGDPNFFESFVGLYFGKISVRPSKCPDGSLALLWRADLPWKWPSYDSLTQQQGNPHAQCFPLPNARSFLQGSRYSLRMDDGLGQQLEKLGLAKPFLVYSEWHERLGFATP
jgi:hypothetical protein